MIRFSIVIQNNKNEYLICESPASNTKVGKLEFLGGEIDIDTLPPLNWCIKRITAIIKEKNAIEIEDIQRFEIYWRDDPLWVHTIFTAKIKSGNPQKGSYQNIFWAPIDKINVGTLNVYGLQVYRKISECGYCYFLHDRKQESDEFFESFLNKEEENLALLEALESIEGESPIYLLAFKQELVHLRAMLIENTKLRNNITVQNYFNLNGRSDLAEKIDNLLQIEVRSNTSLRKMIKESVDKHIAHYDRPTEESLEIYNYGLDLFSKTGKLPLKQFIALLDGYIIGLVTEMWYDAGELDTTMSNRNHGQRQRIINRQDRFIEELIHILKFK